MEPSETKALKPTPSRKLQSRMAVHSAPLWLRKATLPLRAMLAAKVALSARCGSITPRQDGTWSIVATYTVTNVGTATANGGWTDMGFLSSNGVLDVNSQSDNYFLYGAGSLAPGASYTQTVPFIVKATTAPEIAWPIAARLHQMMAAAKPTLRPMRSMIRPVTICITA